MLSRTADHLFWMSRYTERAENTARMLDVNYQTSLLPQSAAVAQVGWQGLLSISELLPSYRAKYADVTPHNVMEFMVKDESNPDKPDGNKIGFEYLDGPVTPKPEKLPGARKRTTPRKPKPGGPKGSTSKGPLVRA